MSELRYTEKEIYDFEDRRLLNFFEDSILLNGSFQTTLNNLTAATALVDRGLISVYNPKIDVVFSQCKKNFISLGRCSKEKFDEDKFMDFNLRFRRFGESLENCFDDLKSNCDLNERTRLVDREEIVQGLYDKCYVAYKSCRAERNMKENSIKAIKNQFEL